MSEQNNDVINMTKQHFDETYGSKAPENYERFFVPSIGKPLAKDLIRHARLHPGERVLDVACGTGIVARLAVEKVGVTGTVAGLDINPGMLAVARSISQQSNSVTWYEASAEAIPLPDETYDAVLCQLGLQFMDDKVAVLQEMRRILKPHGRLFFNVPGPAGDIFATLAELMERYISPQAAGFIGHVFSLHNSTGIKSLLNNAGFHKVDIWDENKMLSLPPPKEFLWQYVCSTPLINLVANADDETLTALEDEVNTRWQKFTENGVLKYKQRIVIAGAYT